MGRSDMVVRRRCGIFMIKAVKWLLDRGRWSVGGRSFGVSLQRFDGNPRAQSDTRGLIPITRQPAVFQLEFHHLNGAAALLGLALGSTRSASRVGEIKQIGTIPIHHDVRVSALHLIVFAGAGFSH
jgi:hypothetical protein